MGRSTCAGARNDQFWVSSPPPPNARFRAAQNPPFFFCELCGGEGFRLGSRAETCSSCGASTRPLNCHSGSTCAMRTRRIMSVEGSPGGAGRIGGKGKRRHHDFIDRNREGRRVGNFVRWRRRIGMKLVGVGELADLNCGSRGMSFSRRRRLRLRQHRRI